MILATIRKSNNMRKCLLNALIISFIFLSYLAGEEISVYAGDTVQKPETFAEGTFGVDLVFVKGGCFQMGDQFGDGNNTEKPVHEVCVGDFYIGKYEVTIAEFGLFVSDSGYRTDAEKEGRTGVLNSSGDGWEKRDGTSWQNPGFDQNVDHPVVNVSWNDAVAYIAWLNQNIGSNYRLLTEAEWEYAARSGGKRHKYGWGSNDSPEGNIAGDEVKREFPKRSWPVWDGYDDGYVFTSPVGSFNANELGLYDMTGNVWEWCQDRYSEDAYRKHQRDNPIFLEGGSNRVNRGGSWFNWWGTVHASFRGRASPVGRRSYLGFRLARTP